VGANWRDKEGARRREPNAPPTGRGKASLPWKVVRWSGVKRGHSEAVAGAAVSVMIEWPERATRRRSGHRFAHPW
jgi:hypothetical protein